MSGQEEEQQDRADEQKMSDALKSSLETMKQRTRIDSVWRPRDEEKEEVRKNNLDVQASLDQFYDPKYDVAFSAEDGAMFLAALPVLPEEEHEEEILQDSASRKRKRAEPSSD